MKAKESQGYSWPSSHHGIATSASGAKVGILAARCVCVCVRAAGCVCVWGGGGLEAICEVSRAVVCLTERRRVCVFSTHDCHVSNVLQFPRKNWMSLTVSPVTVKCMVICIADSKVKRFKILAHKHTHTHARTHACPRTEARTHAHASTHARTHTHVPHALTHTHIK